MLRNGYKAQFLNLNALIYIEWSENSAKTEIVLPGCDDSYHGNIIQTFKKIIRPTSHKAAYLTRPKLSREKIGPLPTLEVS